MKIFVDDINNKYILLIIVLLKPYSSQGVICYNM